MKTNIQALLKKPICLLGTGFGVGLIPKAPGTMGTVMAIPFYYVMQYGSVVVYLTVTMATFVAGIWICQITADWLKQTDPPAVVWDEMVGYLVTMTAAPTGWYWMLTGFVLFRFFDIIKPWPINWADKRFHGGFGIMLDDLIAGIAAAFLLQLFSLF